MAKIRVNGKVKRTGKKSVATSSPVSTPETNGPVEQNENGVNGEASTSTALVPMNTEPVAGPSSAAATTPSQTLIVLWKDAVEKVCSSNPGLPTTPTVMMSSLEYQVNYSEMWQDERNEPFLGKLKLALKGLGCLTSFQVAVARKHANEIVHDIKQQCDYNTLYAFFRFDDFMCAVELRERFYMAKYPIAVVSHSMVKCANKLARVTGVRINMCASLVLQICPRIILLQYDFDKYNQARNEIKKILQEYDACVKMKADCAEICLIPNLEVSTVDAVDLVRQIKARIQEATDLRCTAGIGPTTVVASLAAETSCPAYGITEVKANRFAVASFMEILDLTKFGPLSSRLRVFLRVLNLCNAAEILSNRLFLIFLFKKRKFYQIMGAALGIPTDSMRLRFIRTTKIPSILNQTAVFFPVNDKEMISQHCRSICNVLAKELREMHMGGRLIMAFIITSGLERKKKAHSMIEHTNDPASLYEATMKIINAFYEDDPKIMFSEIEIQVRELVRLFYDGEDAAEMDGFMMPPPPLTLKETRAHHIRKRAYSIYDIHHAREPLTRLLSRGSLLRTIPFVKGTEKPYMMCSNCGFKVEASIPENCETLMRYHNHLCLRDVGPLPPKGKDEEKKEKASEEKETVTPPKVVG